VGLDVGLLLGPAVGLAVGKVEGANEGDDVGADVGLDVGDAVGQPPQVTTHASRAPTMGTEALYSEVLLKCASVFASQPEYSLNDRLVFVVHCMLVPSSKLGGVPFGCFASTISTLAVFGL
jgi:hypothetical protein